MARYNCTLGLVRRLWPVVDGEHYHGEIMRYRLHAELEAPHRGETSCSPASDYQLELRISGLLLAHPRWDALRVHEVACHGMAYLRELVQRDGLPPNSLSTYILSETTDGGAFLKGSPYAEIAPTAHRPFTITSELNLNAAEVESEV
jgi:hypothetical protein